MNDFKTLFQTEYKTNYSEPNFLQKQHDFVSKYSTKYSTTIISAQSRPKNMKYKSRLVAK